MEDKYWMLRKRCEEAFNEWFGDKTDDKFVAYTIALSLFQDFCMDVLEQLMEKNPEVLRNLKGWD